LPQSGTFEAFFQASAACYHGAYLIQMFDSTTMRAHVSAADAKGGGKIRRSAARVVDFGQKSTSNAISITCRSTSI
jgi:hypothetical protein